MARSFPDFPVSTLSALPAETLFNVYHESQNWQLTLAKLEEYMLARVYDKYGLVDFVDSDEEDISLALTHGNKYVVYGNTVAEEFTLFIPLHATVPFPQGFKATFRNGTAFIVNVTTAVGVVLTTSGDWDFTLTGSQTLELIYYKNNEWLCRVS